jgi:thiol-disulfide isomerase/thioredoxin
MRLSTPICVAAISVSGFVQAADTWNVVGVLVDRDGKPVHDFVAGTFWSANGQKWENDGTFKRNRTAKEIAAHWSDEGEMVPHPVTMPKRLEDNRFALDVKSARPAISVFVTDREQRVGGYHSFDKDKNDSPATIVLKPLVRVTGQITCSEANKTPGWTMAIIHPPGDFGNYKHFTQCGSTNGKFSFLLPPGDYDLQVYGHNPDARMPKPHERDDAPKDMPPYLPGVRVTISEQQSEVDLGMLNLKLTPAGKLEVALTKRLGQEPPALRVADARGVKKNLQLKELRGRWVLLDFWHFACGPCITQSLPELMSFYEAHKDRQDQFEVLSICVDIDGTVKTIQDVDRAMEPHIKTTWNGKKPTFPILVDAEGRTSASFGVSKFPSLLLFSPDGNLVDVGIESPLEVLGSKLE